MKSNNALPKPALLAALLLSVVVPVRADITIFTDEAMFLSAVSASGTDRFDDLPASELDAELSRTAGAYGYRVSAGPGEGGFFPAMNEGDVYLAPTLAADAVRFNAFSPGVFGFGGSFFATDAYGGYVPGRTIELTAMDGSSNRKLHPGWIGTHLVPRIPVDPPLDRGSAAHHWRARKCLLGDRKQCCPCCAGTIGIRDVPSGGRHRRLRSTAPARACLRLG